MNELPMFFLAFSSLGIFLAVFTGLRKWSPMETIPLLIANAFMGMAMQKTFDLLKELVDRGSL